MKRPVEPEPDDVSVIRAKMEFLARQMEHLFNGDLRGQDRLTCFVLLTFPFNDNQERCSYISNASTDVVSLMKEQVARFESTP